MNGGSNSVGKGVKVTQTGRPKFSVRFATSPLPQGVILRRSPEVAYNQAMGQLRRNLVERGFIYEESEPMFPVNDD